MATDILVYLSIGDALIFDDRIVRTHTYNPYSTYRVHTAVGSVHVAICKDYKRIVINARLELILIRTRKDNNCVVAHQKPKITMLRVLWRMSHVILNVTNCHSYECWRANDLSMGFRSWDLYEFPLQSMTKHSWTVKGKIAIFALQIRRKNVPTEDVSRLLQAEQCETLFEFRILSLQQYEPRFRA
ncbi:hypothetical protein P5V15_015231 [Pogonomyrmex californicus]